ncbi:MAG: hypothetical protein ACYDHN_10425 [Solirubrobacteraceae bacterium]
MAADLLASISAEIDARLQELRPLLAEYERLLEAADALGLADGKATAVAAAPAAPLAAKVEGAKAGRAVTTGSRRRAAGPRGSAAGAIGRASSKRSEDGKGATRTRAVRGAAQQAILAALEHGSHTVGELTVVTAMSGQNIRENLRRMLSSGAVTRAKREGKAAYALASSAAAH